MQSDGEKKIMAKLHKNKSNIDKHLSAKTPKFKQATKEIDDYRNNLDTYATFVNSSIDDTKHPASITYLRELWLNEEFQLVSWVDDKERWVEIQSEELRKTTIPVTSKDEQIRQTKTAILNKIKKHSDILSTEHTLAQCNLVSRVCRDMRAEVNGLLHQIHSLKGQLLPNSIPAIMQDYNKIKEEIFNQIDSMILS